MLVWCLVSVAMECVPKVPCFVDTAAKGKIISQTDNHYIVDFSDYSRKMGYIGNYNNVVVEKTNCGTEKELK